MQRLLCRGALKPEIGPENQNAVGGRRKSLKKLDSAKEME
jgi:hypothetical protein